MYKSALFIGFFLLLVPTYVSAQTASPSCSEKGYTVIYVNGIFDSYQDALKNSAVLNQKIGFTLNGQSVIVRLGYNQTHLNGLGDLLQTAAQLFSKSITDFDLDTILMQVYPEITTRKLLIVGHSQGALYANDMYHYLLSNGEPSGAVAVYGVATPGAYVAGHGKYINSSGDPVLAELRSLKFDVLPNNADLMPAGTDSIAGHYFVDDYLNNAGPQIQSDITSELDDLQPIDATDSDDCFTPPTASLGYKVQSFAFAVADPTAADVKTGVDKGVQNTVALVSAVTKVASGALQFFSDTISVTSNPPSDAKATSATDKVINKLYGSSVDGLSPQDKKDLLGSAQGAAVALSHHQDNPSAINGGLVDGTSTEDVSVPVAPTSTVASIFPTTSNGPAWPGGGGGNIVAVNTAPIEEVVAPESTSTPDVKDEQDEATTTPPAADEPTTTPEVVLPAGAPIVDSFDLYDGSGWSVWPSPNGTYVYFYADLGAADPLTTDPTVSDCHADGCIISAGNAGGLGSFSYVSSIYKENGVPQNKGAFTVWIRARAGWRAPQASVGFCLGTNGGCTNGNLQWFSDIAPADDAWHQYYFAWRQGSTAMEVCFLKDDTNPADCGWQASGFPLGTQVDGVNLYASVSRPDLGDRVWFDDLEGPTQN